MRANRGMREQWSGRRVSSITHPYARARLLRRLRRRHGGHALVLQAQRHEDVLQPLERLAREKLFGEVDGETGAVVLKLVPQRVAVQRGNEADQLFDLVRLQHREPTPLTSRRAMS